MDTTTLASNNYVLFCVLFIYKNYEICACLERLLASLIIRIQNIYNIIVTIVIIAIVYGRVNYPIRGRENTTTGDAMGSSNHTPQNFGPEDI